MKSIYLRNFTVMAILVFSCMILLILSFVGIGRQYLVRAMQGDLVASADEVSHLASAVGQSDSLDGWLLNMNVRAISNSTGNQIMISDPAG
ncbi:MAG: hypothetical protein IKS25_01475, partial [Oscillospiraceae bacterium]|nr:hypothetical protein [Oscillospiraceae bacterium]